MTPKILDTFLRAGPVTPDFRASVQKEIAKMIPEGKVAALVAVAAADGLHFTVAARVKGGWELAGTLEKAWAGPVSGVVSLIHTW